VRVGGVDIYEVNTPSDTASPPGDNSFISTDTIELKARLLSDEVNSNNIDWKVIGVNSGNANSGSPVQIDNTATISFVPAPINRPITGNLSKNDPLGYEIEAKINTIDFDTHQDLVPVGVSPLAPIVQDVIDVMRQEYVDFNIPVPSREKFTYPFREDVSTGPYPLIVDDGLSAMYNLITSTFRTQLVNEYGTDYDQEYELTLSSGYRNPQYNKHPLGANSNVPDSKHVYGRALDLVVPGIPGRTEEELYCVLYRAGVSLGSTYTPLVEFGPQDLTPFCSDTRVNHLHLHRN
ncbi:MAG: hypothetical protein GY820_47800, partial [Gammaproteobacteria bacterium]|nr:hypothetical protein [Gammaproteobacteria bacterium]